MLFPLSELSYLRRNNSSGRKEFPSLLGTIRSNCIVDSSLSGFKFPMGN